MPIARILQAICRIVLVSKDLDFGLPVTGNVSSLLKAASIAKLVYPLALLAVVPELCFLVFFSPGSRSSPSQRRFDAKLFIRLTLAFYFTRVGFQYVTNLPKLKEKIGESNFGISTRLVHPSKLSYYRPDKPTYQLPRSSLFAYEDPAL